MYYSDCGCWAARGRAVQEGSIGRASLKGGDSDTQAKREEDGSGPARLGVGGAGSSRADVRLLRVVGRAK
jgi:hypothetical protein